MGKFETSKSHSEINWPLQQSKNSNRQSQSFSTTRIFRDDTSSEDNGTVVVEKMEEFKIVCIGINRPAKRNCVNKVTAEKLYDAFSAFENDESLNCAVLHGKKWIKPLTLIGKRQGGLTSLMILDWILTAEFLSKNFKHFWRWKLRSIGIIWHPAKLIEYYRTCS